MSELQFINRELSWLEFNQRVLDEATYPHNPLFERLKFAAIVCSNLDEFFMIRVASVRDQILAGLEKSDATGMSPSEIMSRIASRAHKMTEDLYQKYALSLQKGLRKEKIAVLKRKEISSAQKKHLDDYFDRNVFPVLTPMVVDSGRPFPLVLNKSLNIALLVADRTTAQSFCFATVQVPAVLDRLVELPSDGPDRQFILLEELIKMKLEKIFVGHHILAKACYRITRNADLSINEEGAEDLLAVIEESLLQRKWGAVIRLEVEHDTDPRIMDRLLRELDVTEEHIYRIPGPIDLKFLQNIASLKGYGHLRFAPFEPACRTCLENGGDLFEAIRQNDILLHHPYHSFQPVLDLVLKAADDEHVLAIKQTLYRVSDDSPMIEALVRAAENGKQVTVMLEIKARFDEQNNIHWAKRLEKSGCHVIYGYAGLKTHCKVLLIVRSEEDGIKRYVHLSTGNYNEVTARLYTDIGILSSNTYWGADASNLFNMLSGLSQPMQMHQLIIAPNDLRKKMTALIRREKENALAGKEAKIIIKINSLVDRKMIESLYEASQAGVQITLIVRGMCCLVPGIPGTSDRITVHSIVGRFLEHSRIYYFYQDGAEAIFLSSADLMERNLDRRVEAMFPILDERIKKEIKNILAVTMSDTQKMKEMQPDGTYKKVRSGRRKSLSSQAVFLEETYS